MLFAFDTGKTNMNERRHMAGVQMLPLPFLHMVVNRAIFVAFWTRKHDPRLVINIDIDPLRSLSITHFPDMPWPLDPQQTRVQLGVFHSTPPGY